MKIKSLISVFLLSFILSLSLYGQGEIVLRFEEGTSQDSIDALRDSLNATELAISPISHVRKWLVPDSIYLGGDSVDIKEGIKYARSRTRIKEVDENFEILIPEPTPGTNFIPVSFCLPSLLVPSGPREIVIGLIDSGIDTSHTFYDGKEEYFWENEGEIAGNGLDDDGNGYVDDVYGYNFFEGDANPADSNGHGTHISSTMMQIFDSVAARHGGGVRPPIRIMNLKTQDAGGKGSIFGIILALDYAISNGANIVNMSLGYYPDTTDRQDTLPTPLRFVINLLTEGHNILAVAATGNETKDIDDEPFFPAAYPEMDRMLSVSAADCGGFLPPFSNFGAAGADLAAPGVSIYSAVPGGIPNDDWESKSGTSMAAGIASAVAALLGTYIGGDKIPPGPNYAFNSDAIKTAIMAGVDVRPALLPVVLSGGMIFASGALDSLLFKSADISGLVWDDLNADGIQDLGEGPVPTVVVDLYNTDNQWVATDTTKASGSYIFNILAADGYDIRFRDLPTGLSFSPQMLGGDPAKDSDPEVWSGVTSLAILAEGDSLVHIDAGLQAAPSITISSYLEGAYRPAKLRMGDELRIKSLIPAAEPYTDLGYSLTDGVGQPISLELLGDTGSAAPIDWMVLEFRNAISHAVLAAVPVIILADGSIIKPNGEPLSLAGLGLPATATIVLRHRNHLPVRSLAGRTLSGLSLDFRLPATFVFYSDSRASLGGGLLGQTAGDTNNDQVINSTDKSNAWNDRNNEGYENSDVELNSAVNAADRSLIQNNRNKAAGL